MPTANLNGVDIFYETSGAGEQPLVLVHGSWGSHRNWSLVVPRLSRHFTVLTYDRRGHSDSQRIESQGSIREDVADLAALIEHLGMAPAWIAGNSFGASITLRLAGERPDLFRGLIAHEPPLFSLLEDDPDHGHLFDDTGSGIEEVLTRIEAGNHAEAAEFFIEQVAFGRGGWAELAPEMQRTLIYNAPTYLDEARDPEALAFDLHWIEDFSGPALLTTGDRSPPIFAPVVAKLAAALTSVQTRELPGAGHVPHLSHPELYVDSVLGFTKT